MVPASTSLCYSNPEGGSVTFHVALRYSSKDLSLISKDDEKGGQHFRHSLTSISPFHLGYFATWRVGRVTKGKTENTRFSMSTRIVVISPCGSSRGNACKADLASYRIRISSCKKGSVETSAETRKADMSVVVSRPLA
jgi:hypothetical protein